MRALAEFVMRGRTQAIGVCLVGAIFPPIHGLFAAVVSLVVLRKGMTEGGLVLMWAGLPMLAYLAIYQDVTPVYSLLGAFSLAYILRSTVSWELTLAATVMISIVGALLFEVVAADLINQFVNRYLEYLVEIRAQAGGSAENVILPTAAQAHDILFGMLALGFAINLLAFLVLARWWQSELYNPGGFGQEFRLIRLSPAFGAVLAVVLLACYGLGEFARWGQLITVPLMMAAIGFVHWAVSEKQLSKNWLVSFYIMLVLMFQLILPVLISLALMDSWFDLRKRFRSDREV